MDKTDFCHHFPEVPRLPEAEEADFITKQETEELRRFSEAQTQALDHMIPLLQRMLCKAQEQAELLRSWDNSQAMEPIYKYSIGLSSDIRKLESCFYACCDAPAGNPFIANINTSAQEGHAPEDIQIITDSEKILIRLPYLPGRGYAPRSMIFQLLDAELHRQSEFPQWSKWSAAFYHVYGKTGSYTPRDVDNYDIKRAIDLIAHRLGTSDDPVHFHITAMRTLFTDEIPTGSYIVIQPKSSENPDFEILKSFFLTIERPEKTS